MRYMVDNTKKTRGRSKAYLSENKGGKRKVDGIGEVNENL